MLMKRYAFIRWLAEARRGEGAIYHIGNLMADRQNGLDYQHVHAMGVTAWSAYKDKICTLIQNKRDDGLYEYIAVKL